MSGISHNGKIVKEIRETLGVSQEELGNKIGLTQQAISALENQEVIDDERLSAIWKALNPDFNLLKKLQNRIDNQRITNIDNQSGATITQIEKVTGDYVNNPLKDLINVAENRVSDIKEILQKETAHTAKVTEQLMDASKKLGEMEFYKKRVTELEKDLAVKE